VYSCPLCLNLGNLWENPRQAAVLRVLEENTCVAGTLWCCANLLKPDLHAVRLAVFLSLCPYYLIHERGEACV
jgi:hypothetical protein